MKILEHILSEENLVLKASICFLVVIGMWMLTITFKVLPYFLYYVVTMPAGFLYGYVSYIMFRRWKAWGFVPFFILAIAFVLLILI